MKPITEKFSTHLIIAFTIFATIPNANTSFNLPFFVNTDCFVPIIFSDNNTAGSDYLFSSVNSYGNTVNRHISNFLNTWMIFKSDKIDLAFSSLELTNKEHRTDLKQKYFRFSRMVFSSHCVVALVYTSVLDDVISTIYNTGVASRNFASVFLYVQSVSVQDELVLDIIENLLTTDTDDKFQTKLFYFSLNSRNKYTVGIHCYFCPALSEKLVISRSYKLETLDNLWMQQNLNANQNSILPNVAAGITPVDGCSTVLDSVENREKFVDAMTFCRHTDHVILAPLFRILNITILPIYPVINRIVQASWFLNIGIGENRYFIPTDFAATRFYYSYIYERPELYRTVAYIPLNKMSRLDYSIFTTLNWTACLLLFLVVASYAKLYQNIWYGMDLIWHFFGLSSCLEHKRKIIGCYFLWMTIVFQMYSANISSDSLKLFEFPTKTQLFDQGYRLWMHPDMTYGESNHKAINLATYISQLTKRHLKRKDLVYHMLNSSELPKSFEQFVSMASERKLISVQPNYAFCPSTTMSFVLDNIICKGFF